MELEIKQEDIQSVMQANPIVALQVENQALKRKLQETAIAFDGAMIENKRLTEELENQNQKVRRFMALQSKTGKSLKEK